MDVEGVEEVEGVQRVEMALSLATEKLYTIWWIMTTNVRRDDTLQARGVWSQKNVEVRGVF